MTPRTGRERGTAVGYGAFRLLRGDDSMATAPDPLRLHAEGNPDRAAVIVDRAGGDRVGTLTFAELNAEVNRTAHALRAFGMKPGDRLVWCGPNSVEVLVTIHAARKA